MKRIVITGASGFVGKVLSEHFLEQGHHVTGMGTSGTHPFSDTHDHFQWVSADTTQPGVWQKQVEQAHVVINLAGRNIFRYWTKKYKQAIYDSRVMTTQNVVDALAKGRDQVLLNASAVGIYGDCKETVLTETSPPGQGFLADVCRIWEKQALQAEQKGARVSILRFGVVLGNGGALSKMLPAFKMFVGGPLGSGNHWFPWIHITDLTRAVAWLIENEDQYGVFNFTGPLPVRQKEFAKMLGAALNRPGFMPAPAFMIKLLMGELGASLLQSQKAIPDNLQSGGFSFEFPDVVSALNDIVKN